MLCLFVHMTIALQQTQPLQQQRQQLQVAKAPILSSTPILGKHYRDNTNSMHGAWPTPVRRRACAVVVDVVSSLEDMHSYRQLHKTYL